uniref:probable flap endonuclease 1 homolog isoform X2 n=1 Tax=Monopterus albus TaxID=43700 RepID=UPI0009B45FAB|nr:probable flap endonuclease 1 homolog isoform X2 [Monopterus albus]
MRCAKKVYIFCKATILLPCLFFLPCSPLAGLFFRTLTLLEHDIKPVFVLDGRPPAEKTPVLEKRAKAAGWRSPNCMGTESSQKENCIKLLELLGVPVVKAPGDAEALCAQLVKRGTVDAAASEDMDTLPFGASFLIRHLNAKRDSNVIEYSLTKLLDKLNITHKEFVDLCILLGCDYCDKITGLGPKKALTLIQKHHTIENVVLHINRQAHTVPMSWGYKEARKIFLDAPQTEVPELKWTEPNEEALVKFLCQAGHIKENRISHRMETFRKTREKRERERAAGQSRQTQMQDFFRVTRKRGKPMEAADASSSGIKRPKSK